MRPLDISPFQGYLFLLGERIFDGAMASGFISPRVRLDKTLSQIEPS